MDSFQLIQKFFTRMSCEICNQHFEPSGIELVREEDGVYIVSVYCHQCEQQIGIAMVGVESADMPLERVKESAKKRFADPELTPEEQQRLLAFDPINEEDVLEAHRFFKNLDENWTQHLPLKFRTLETAPDTESPST